MPLKIIGNIDPELANKCVSEVGQLFNQAGFNPESCYIQHQRFQEGSVYVEEDVEFWQMAQATVELIVDESNQNADCCLTWEE